MPRLISTRSLVTSLPSTTTPGVTPMARPHLVISRYLKLHTAGSWKAPQQPSRTRQRLVEEIEQVVVHGHDPLHELHVAHEPRVVIGEELDRGRRAHAARIQGR